MCEMGWDRKMCVDTENRMTVCARACFRRYKIRRGERSRSLRGHTTTYQRCMRWPGIPLEYPEAALDRHVNQHTPHQCTSDGQRRVTSQTGGGVEGLAGRLTMLVRHELANGTAHFQG